MNNKKTKRRRYDDDDDDTTVCFETNFPVVLTEDCGKLTKV